MEKLKAIQMIGTQRSGSNLLRVMLQKLNISAPHPPHIMERFMPIISMYGDLYRKDNFARLVEDVCQLVETNPVNWGDLILDRKQIIVECQYPELIEIVRVIYEAKCKYDDSDMWICKSMGNIHYIDALEKYIKPYYLFLFRDGRDVALSFKKAIVGEKHIYFLAKQWKEEQDLCLQLYKKLGPERVILIRYEDLIAMPEFQLNRICQFLKIHFQEGAMQYYQSNESKATALAGKMWENVQKPVIADNFNKYKNELSEEDIQIFESIAGDTLKALGYSEDFPEIGHHKFSETEIDVFNKQNQMLKAVAKSQQLETDAQKREKQNMLLNRLQNQYNSYIATAP